MQIVLTEFFSNLFTFGLLAVKLYVNESVSIPYTVSNAGAGEIDVVVKIEDDQMFTTDPKFKSHTLKVGENGTGIYIITAGSVAGVTRQVSKPDRMPGLFKNIHLRL